MATVGEISAFPGAANVIPGEVELSLDLRHGEDAVRESLRDHFARRAKEIARSRGCEFGWQVRQETPAVPVDTGLTDILGQAVEGSGVAVDTVAERRGARRGPDGRDHPRSDALRPVRRGHKPQPRRVRHERRRRRGGRGNRTLYKPRRRKRCDIRKYKAMSTYDLIVRDCVVITPEDLQKADIGVSELIRRLIQPGPRAARMFQICREREAKLEGAQADERREDKSRRVRVPGEMGEKAVSENC